MREKSKRKGEGVRERERKKNFVYYLIIIYESHPIYLREEYTRRRSYSELNTVITPSKVAFAVMHKKITINRFRRMEAMMKHRRKEILDKNPRP